MAKLYELAESYEMLLDMIDNQDISVEDVQDTLEALEDSIGEKLENIVKIIRMTEGNIELFKAEEKRIQARRRTMENKVDSLKNYMQSTMIRLGMKKVETGTFKIRLQKNPDNISILDESKIPKDFYVKQEPKLDKTALKEAVLKEGKEIEGVTKAPESYHVRIQ